MMSRFVEKKVVKILHKKWMKSVYGDGLVCVGRNLDFRENNIKYK